MSGFAKHERETKERSRSSAEAGRHTGVERDRRGPMRGAAAAIGGELEDKYDFCLDHLRFEIEKDERIEQLESHGGAGNAGG